MFRFDTSHHLPVESGTQMSSKFQWLTNGNDIFHKTLNLPTFTERLVNINQDTSLSVDNLCNKVQDILIEAAKSRQRG